jgi:hypothetical protein
MRKTLDPCVAVGGLGGPFEAPHPNKQGRVIAEPALVSTKRQFPAPCAASGGLGGPFEAPHPKKETP